MNRNTLKILQVYLWLICAFHLVVGVGLNLFPGMPEVMADAYGAKLEATPEFLYILKPLGAFMLVLGLLAAAAARKPQQHRAVIYGFAILFAIRAFQRLIFSQEIAEVFEISSSRNIGNMLLFFGMAIALVVLDRLVNASEPEATTQPAA